MLGKDRRYQNFASFGSEPFRRYDQETNNLTFHILTLSLLSSVYHCSLYVIKKFEDRISLLKAK